MIDERRLPGVLRWVTQKLEAHALPYQVVGGLAARAYGATRPLLDINLYAPLGAGGSFLEDIRTYVLWGPQVYVDEHWKLAFVKVSYRGCRIEIGDSTSNPRLFDSDRTGGCPRVWTTDARCFGKLPE